MPERCRHEPLHLDRLCTTGPATGEPGGALQVADGGIHRGVMPATTSAAVARSPRAHSRDTDFGAPKV